MAGWWEVGPAAERGTAAASKTANGPVIGGWVGERLAGGAGWRLRRQRKGVGCRDGGAAGRRAQRRSEEQQQQQW